MNPRYYAYTRHVLANGHECVLLPYSAAHPGIDLTDWNAVACGQDVDVVAYDDCTVTDVIKGAQIGNSVSILHEGGVLTRYWHLKEIKVNCGQSVRRGDVIGVMGETGTARSSGMAHVHFAVKTGAKSWDTGVYVDPQLWLMGFR